MAGGDQFLECEGILWVAAIFFHGFVNLLVGATVVEVAVGIFVKGGEEIFGERLLGEIDAEVAAVEFEKDVGATRCGDACFSSYFSSKEFAQISNILDLIVEVEFFHSMKPLTSIGNLEVEGERWPATEVLESSRGAFQFHHDFLRRRRASCGDFGDCAFGVVALVLAEFRKLFGGEGNLEVENGPRKKISRELLMSCRFLVLRGLRWWGVGCRKARN